MKISPRAGSLALLLGCALGFAGAVVAGRQAADYSKPSHFVRFHVSISPETDFLPTFPMLENLALARWQPGRTVVIVGGNSILNGVGQSDAHLWTRRLQEELGAHYVVVNLAFRGAYSSEGGALVAESLLRRGVPVIYVADNGPGNCGRAYGKIYGYLYWQALAQGRLLPFPGRDAHVAKWRRALRPPERMQQEEQARAARLDARLHFQSLWEHIGYRHVFTVWTSILRTKWWRARDQFPDPETDPPPVAERFRNSFEEEMNIVRGASETKSEPDAQGVWRTYIPTLLSLGDEIETTFPAALRPRMLMLLTQSCPAYRDHFTPTERARDELVYTDYRNKWREKGVACEITGSDFAREDFADRCHLGPTGGAKLARFVAGEVRRLAGPAP